MIEHKIKNHMPRGIAYREKVMFLLNVSSERQQNKAKSAFFQLFDFVFHGPLADVRNGTIFFFSQVFKLLFQFSGNFESDHFRFFHGREYRAKESSGKVLLGKVR